MTPGESPPTPDLGFLTGEVWRTAWPAGWSEAGQGCAMAHVCVLSKETKAKTRRGPV